MSGAMELASLLINRSQDLIDTFHRHLDLNDHEDAYKEVFEIFFQAIKGKPFLLNRDLYRDARLREVLSSVKELLKAITSAISEHSASVLPLAGNMLRKAQRRLNMLPGDRPRYVVACDGLSIIDATYIASRLKKESVDPFMTPMINPGGYTETYKFILKTFNYISGDRITLDTIVRDVAGVVHAKYYTVFRGYDKAIHELNNVPAIKIIDAMYELTSRLYSEIVRLRRDFNGAVMVLSDHGYDVVAGDGAGLYKVVHRWGPNSFSVIAPLLVIG